MRMIIQIMTDRKRMRGQDGSRSKINTLYTNKLRQIKTMYKVNLNEVNMC